jgi:murein DD-endopeptidase MepM/ murein hydrolase activator NlpD
MRARFRTLQICSVRVLVGVLIAASILATPGLPRAEAYSASGAGGAGDPRLERAQERRRAVEQQLGELHGRLDRLEAEAAEVEANLNALQATERAQAEQAQSATGLLAARLRESYKRGTSDPAFALFASDSPGEAAEQARLLGLLAVRSRAEYEGAAAARVRTEAAAGEVAKAADELHRRQDALEAARADVAALLAKAAREERAVQATLAAEQAARERAARERAARERAARDRAARVASAANSAGTSSRGSAAAPARSGGGAAPAVGGAACPVGSPRNYSDTYGAPRSGGRRHKGTDILAPHGTPIYAYENGTIARTNNSRVGGISIYLRGDSGTVYYYTHLQGYVSGLAPGRRVAVGQHIAFNGDTGNARGIPHLHFEVMPGGGGNVNPYPYVRRACG